MGLAGDKDECYILHYVGGAVPHIPCQVHKLVCGFCERGVGNIPAGNNHRWGRTNFPDHRGNTRIELVPLAKPINIIIKVKKR